MYQIQIVLMETGRAFNSVAKASLSPQEVHFHWEIPVRFAVVSYWNFGGKESIVRRSQLKLLASPLSLLRACS